MPWVQQYAPVGGVVASACLAAIPLIILFYMLAVRKAKGHVAAAAGPLRAVVVAGAGGLSLLHPLRRPRAD